MLSELSVIYAIVARNSLLKQLRKITLTRCLSKVDVVLSSLSNAKQFYANHE